MLEVGLATTRTLLLNEANKILPTQVSGVMECSGLYRYVVKGMGQGVWQGTAAVSMITSARAKLGF